LKESFKFNGFPSIIFNDKTVESLDIKGKKHYCEDYIMYLDKYNEMSIPQGFEEG